MSKYNYNRAHYEYGFKDEITLPEMSEAKTYRELAKILTQKYIANLERVRFISKKYNYENDTYEITVFFTNGFTEKNYNIKY